MSGFSHRQHYGQRGDQSWQSGQGNVFTRSTGGPIGRQPYSQYQNMPERQSYQPQESSHVAAVKEIPKVDVGRFLRKSDDNIRSIGLSERACIYHAKAGDDLMLGMVIYTFKTKDRYPVNNASIAPDVFLKMFRLEADPAEVKKVVGNTYTDKTITYNINLILENYGRRIESWSSDYSNVCALVNNNDITEAVRNKLKAEIVSAFSDLDFDDHKLPFLTSEKSMLVRASDELLDFVKTLGISEAKDTDTIKNLKDGKRVLYIFDHRSNQIYKF